jgi:hypothetical protein
VKKYEGLELGTLGLVSIKYNAVSMTYILNTFYIVMILTICQYLPHGATLAFIIALLDIEQDWYKNYVYEYNM